MGLTNARRRYNRKYIILTHFGNTHTYKHTHTHTCTHAHTRAYTNSTYAHTQNHTMMIYTVHIYTNIAAYVMHKYVLNALASQNANVVIVFDHLYSAICESKS